MKILILLGIGRLKGHSPFQPPNSQEKTILV
jgi:hypothetical protein